MQFIITEFLGHIVPETKECLVNKPLQRWCPEATEALLFLIIEISQEMWTEEGERQRWQSGPRDEDPVENWLAGETMGSNDSTQIVVNADEHAAAYD